VVKWIVQEHSTIGGNVLQLVEMGPGRGILMNNIIKVSFFFSIIKIEKNKSEFFKVLKKQKYSNTHTFFALYESSPRMRRLQAQTLLGRSVNKV
jgi:SAM-dependent MidA family methyltransferase